MSKNVIGKGVEDTIGSPARRLYYVLCEENYREKKYMVGKVLTIIDACFSDQEQRKAMKDVIGQVFWNSDSDSGMKEVLGQFFHKYAPQLKDEKEIKFWEGDNIPSHGMNHFPDID